jgi:hypothetical protein
MIQSLLYLHYLEGSMICQCETETLKIFSTRYSMASACPNSQRLKLEAAQLKARLKARLEQDYDLVTRESSRDKCSQLDPQGYHSTLSLDSELRPLRTRTRSCHEYSRITAAKLKAKPLPAFLLWLDLLSCHCLQRFS